MNKTGFILLSVILSLCLILLLALPLTAQKDMTLSLSSVSAKAGKQFTLSLSLSENPGVAALYVRLSYDPSVMTLNGVRDNALLEDFAYYDAGGAAVLSFEPATYDNTDNGVLAYLDFTLSDHAPEGDAAIELLPYENGIINKDTDVLTCVLESGMVTVLPGGTVFSDTLSINQETMQIGSVLPGTTVGQIKDALDETVLISQNGAEQSDNALVSTGMTVQSGTRIYTLIVTGDANGDGTCDQNDLNAIKRYLLAQGTPQGAYFLACDVSGDGRITITDFLFVKSYLAGKTALTPRSA